MRGPGRALREAAPEGACSRQPLEVRLVLAQCQLAPCHVAAMWLSEKLSSNPVPEHSLPPVPPVPLQPAVPLPPLPEANAASQTCHSWQRRRRPMSNFSLGYDKQRTICLEKIVSRVMSLHANDGKGQRCPPCLMRRLQPVTCGVTEQGVVCAGRHVSPHKRDRCCG